MVNHKLTLVTGVLCLLLGIALGFLFDSEVDESAYRSLQFQHTIALTVSERALDGYGVAVSALEKYDVALDRCERSLGAVVESYWQIAEPDEITMAQWAKTVALGGGQ